MFNIKMNSIKEIPVLFFPFARPEYARQTFEAIKKAQPRNFYFYCDKAREGNSEEIENNNIVRDYIKEVDWDCNLQTWFRDENIGVYTSILNAIDWFFDNEEMGIILEEDCLPSLAFFDFCRQLLPKYKNDQRVWLLTGNNFIPDYNPNGYDYIFTAACQFQWGWASWRRCWKRINRDGFFIPDIISYRLNFQYLGDRIGAEISNIKNIERQDADGFFRPKSWDYIFQMTMKTEGGIGVIPTKNLVSNIGVIGTNSKKINKYHCMIIPKNDTYIIKAHPPFVLSDIRYTSKFLKFRNSSLLSVRLKHYLRRLKIFIRGSIVYDIYQKISSSLIKG